MGLGLALRIEEKAAVVGALLALSPILVWSFLTPLDQVAVVIYTYVQTVAGYAFACWLHGRHAPNDEPNNEKTRIHQ